MPNKRFIETVELGTKTCVLFDKLEKKYIFLIRRSISNRTLLSENLLSIFTDYEFIKITKIHAGSFKAAYSVTMNIFRKKKFLLKSFVKVELSYVVTINLNSTAENCMEK